MNSIRPAGLDGSPPCNWQSRRLWSLWDMARPFHAWAFIHAKGFLRNYSTYRLVEKIFSSLRWLVPKLASRTGTISDKDRKIYRGAWSSMRAECVDLELTTSVASIDKMLDYLDTPEADYESYWSMGEELEGRLLDEIKNRTFFSLTLKESEFYSRPLDGWEYVLARFPDAQTDIEEAYKCYALSRYTASVFHSLQVVEFGVSSLSQLLGSKDHMHSWTSACSVLNEIIKKRHEDRSDFERTHFAFIEQTQASVVALKNAWRNKINHAHGKLVVMSGGFSPEIAEEILLATRAFMRRLATDAPWPTDEGQPS